MGLVERIKELCQNVNITTSQLERELGFSNGLISRWDKSSPSVDKIVDVAQYFHVSLDFLLGFSENESSYDSLETKFIAKLIKDTKEYRIRWNLFTLSAETAYALSSIFHEKCTLTQEIYSFSMAGNTIYFVADVGFSPAHLYLMIELFENNLEKDRDNSFYLVSKESKMLNELYRTIEKSYIFKENSLKARQIINAYLNDMTESPTELPKILNYSVANNVTVTNPGFVLDARQGKTLSDQIYELKEEIIKIKEHISEKL